MTYFRRLTATVVGTGETFNLYENGEFKNFNRLHELAGKDYEDLNDELLEGTGKDLYTKFECGEIVMQIEFSYEWKTFRIKEEFWPLWGSWVDDNNDIVNYPEIRRLAREWNKQINEMLEQCEEVE